MEPWRAILDGLPGNARVVLRCPTGDAFAELLLACADRRLVAVPLRARVTDTEVARAAAVGASAVVDGSPRASRVSLLDGEPGHPDAAGLAFLVHTPGAGRCVMLGRDEVAGNAARTAALHGFSPVRPHATALPLHHVTALVMSLVGTRLTDAPLVLIEKFDPVTFFAAVEVKGAQTASLVPAQLREVVRAGVHWPDCLAYVITSAARRSRGNWPGTSPPGTGRGCGRPTGSPRRSTSAPPCRCSTRPGSGNSTCGTRVRSGCRCRARSCA